MLRKQDFLKKHPSKIDKQQYLPHVWCLGARQRSVSVTNSQNEIFSVQISSTCAAIVQAVVCHVGVGPEEKPQRLVVTISMKLCGENESH